MKSHVFRNTLALSLLAITTSITGCSYHESSGVHDAATFEKPNLNVIEVFEYDEPAETEEFDQRLEAEISETEEPVDTESESIETEFETKPLLSDIYVETAGEIFPETESVVTETQRIEETEFTVAKLESVEINIVEFETSEIVSEFVMDVKLLESSAISIEENELDWFDTTELSTVSEPASSYVDSVWTRYYTDAQYAQYPAACEVWQIIRSWGWNEAVAAGIIGNMMTECGGLTLDLDWDLYDDTWMYYGLCMWSLYWAPETAGLSIADQMTYLYNTIETNMDYFGGNLKEFLSITDPGYAALYFQWYYEVGISSETRYAGALEAYEYFRTK